MKSKNLIRALVLAAIFAYPAFETVRYFQAKKAVAESEQLLAQVNQQLTVARLKHSQAVTPVSLKVPQ